MKNWLIYLVRTALFGNWERHWGWKTCLKHNQPIYNYSPGMVGLNYCELCDVDKELARLADDAATRKLQDEYRRDVQT